MSKPILCLDFDGVVHLYKSKWAGADIIPDPPVLGAIDFIYHAREHFRIAIYSSRSGQPGGIEAMKNWLSKHAQTWGGTKPTDWLNDIEWPTEKPPAFLTIDDRVFLFEGEWPEFEMLKSFKPWNKK